MFARELPFLKDAGFNCIAVLDPKSPRFADDCFALADALIREKNEKSRYFSEGAKNLLAALIMWVRLRHGAKASLAEVRRLLTAPTIYGLDGPTSGLLHTLVEMAVCEYRPIANLAGRLVARLGDKRAMSTSIQDVIETAVSETRWTDSPPMAESLSGEGFDFRRLREEIWTVYVILPIGVLTTHGTYLRVVISSILNALYEPPSLEEAGRLNPVMLLLEEFAALGHLGAIETALGIARDSKIQLWPHLQDLNQLSDLYPKRWQTFFTGVGALTAFAPRDWHTAEFLSKLCGLKTEIVESENANDHSHGRSWTPHGFPLFRPEALRQMPERQMLCFVEPEPYPFFTVTPPYSELSWCRELDPNPYYDAGRRRR
jgi:type IV secretion system protein VirD4